MFAWGCVDWVGHMAISCDECLCVFTEIVLVIQILKDIHHLFKNSDDLGFKQIIGTDYWLKIQKVAGLNMQRVFCLFEQDP